MIVRSPLLSSVSPRGFEVVCTQCLQNLFRTAPRIGPRRSFTIARHSRTNVLESRIAAHSRLRTGYFLDNGTLASSIGKLKRNDSTSTTINSATEAPINSSNLESSASKTTSIQDLPHRRRQKARKEAAAAVAGEHATDSPETSMPPDASSKLTTLSTNLPTNSLRRKFSILLSLSKPRLSFLIVLTTTSAYTLYPVPTLLSPSITDTPSLSALTLLFLTGGTALTCASANALNMLYEPKWDAMMTRTRNRPLVRGLISTRGALLFAIVTGLAGTAALYYGVNPTVSFLGAFNIFLYAGVYTPLKRVSVLNTWVGAVVGGIPPLMGWAAAAGQSATGTGDWKDLLLGEQNLGGWLLAALLVAWQFPHFMALSWPIREEYKAAGYRMLAWTNPARNARVALRYSLLFLPICIGLCAVGVTEWTFAVASTPLNVWMVREAVRFWRYEGFKGSARGLFWASIWHLPVVLVLAMLEKKGMWQRVWKAVSGTPDFEAEEEQEWEDDEDVEDVGNDGTQPRSPASALSH